MEVLSDVSSTLTTFTKTNVKNGYREIINHGIHFLYTKHEKFKSKLGVDLSKEITYNQSKENNEIMERRLVIWN